MKFEWDLNKNKLNKKKHGLSFEAALFAFNDPFLLSVTDKRFIYLEERWQSIGLIGEVAIYIAHTIGKDNNGEEIIRIISARAATQGETKQYYAHRKNEKRN